MRDRAPRPHVSREKFAILTWIGDYFGHIVVRTPNRSATSFVPRLEMRTSRLTSVLFTAAALMASGAGSAVARDGPATDFSLILEWKNQIISDLEHNKRYLPGTRVRGKLGVVRYELKMNRAGWVLPGTRIVTLDDDLGRVALLLLQQSQPFPPPENVNLPDGAFRVEVPDPLRPHAPSGSNGV